MSEKVYAPAPGVDSEFDDQVEKVLEALTAAGNPENITPEAAREMLAKRMTEFGGKTYTPAAPAEPEKPKGPAKPLALVIPSPSTEPYWYEEPTQAKVIEHYILTRRALGGAFHGALLIVGPAGSGKTMGVPQAVARINKTHSLQMNLLKMDCATITDPQKWFGRREIDKDGSHYYESDLIIAITRGDIVLLDEITRLHPAIANPIMSMLDGSSSLHLSELNLTFPVHPETVFIATANVGVQFGGTHRFDWAMRERFSTTIERDFPPIDEEVRILTSHTGIDADGARVLVDIAHKTRSMYATGDLRSPISTRTLVAASWWVASGMTERQALEITAIPLFDGDANGTIGDKSDRAQVMAAITGKAV